ncbi:hypothetical protein KIL84_022479 [Mauremys mutica]|uniref:Uncharacterized protein n=1 Tax=Mauremys mutica TaxID=74926 RepID=A0A9D3WQQ9_9SAUR|nr:hypothetical protein KIL84_022479 [Mauremys mutica]
MMWKASMSPVWREEQAAEPPPLAPLQIHQCRERPHWARSVGSPSHMIELYSPLQRAKSSQDLAPHCADLISKGRFNCFFPSRQARRLSDLALKWTGCPIQV